MHNQNVDVMKLYCVEVVLDALHPAEENTFYKGVFLQRVSDMSAAEFEVFCTEVEQLERYYFYTLGRWHTDRINCFENIDEDFYRVLFPLDASQINYSANWRLIDFAYNDNGQFSKRQFIQEFHSASDEQVYLFFNNILKLEEHRVYAVNCWYTDRPMAVINTCIAETHQLLFTFEPLDREVPLHFRMRRKRN